jgi:RNA recognition motif-containing protein
VTSSLYIKNLDKKVERTDLVERLLPLFNNERGRVEEEVEIVVMKKGRMRGQGFMNFKRPEDA